MTARSGRPVTPLTTALTLVSLAVLSGCATTSPDAAVEPVQQQIQRHTGLSVARWSDPHAPSSTTQERLNVLLSAPLSQEAAVEIALLNHRGLQADLAELGVTQAELAQLTRLPNPGFSFKRSASGEWVEWERGLQLALGRMLLMPLARPMENARLAQQQTQTTLAVISRIAEARRAWVDAVASEERLRYLSQVHEAAEAGAELARRMVLAGNFNSLSHAREASFEAQARLDLARGERARDSARERLVRALGLWGDQPPRITLPERLPDLPATPVDGTDLESRAVAQRLDVQAARALNEQTARSLGLSRVTGFVSTFDLNLTRARTNEGERSRAWEVGLELPLFDWGGARHARAEALYSTSLHRTAEVAINARSEVREAYRNWHHAWDIARHARDVLVPLRQRISEENVKRYNGMLIGVFELLADARTQIGSVNTALEARRDFWMADADLQMALLGRPSLSSAAATAANAPADAGDGH